MPAPILSLVLYKRHLKACGVHHSKMPIKARRFFMECECPIWIHGRTPSGDLVPRQATGFSDIRQAEAYRNSLLSTGKTEDVQGLPVSECIEKYLRLREQDSDPRTVGQHKLALDRLRQYLELRGVLYMRQLKVDHLESFKTDGLPRKMASTSRANTDAKIRCFLRMAYRRDWINEVLVEKVTPVRGVYEQKEPFTDDEVGRILAESQNLSGGTHGYARKPATFRLLIELMLATGMRVGDAVEFDPRRLHEGEKMWSYAFTPQKARRTERAKPVEVFISAEMKARINDCEWLSTRGPFHYGEHDSQKLAQAVYERMQAIGERAGVADCRPHRLRDTFAVRRLLAGMNLEDVSRLLGHSSVKVTEAFYAKWVSSRKRRLERLLSDSLVNA